MKKKVSSFQFLVSSSGIGAQSAPLETRNQEPETLICGVDEAGRGPLAGPVYAAAVILNPKRPIAGLADSKTLPEKKREALASKIKEHALAWAIAQASVEEIDTLNILQASLLAMKRAIEDLCVKPEEIVVDGTYVPNVAFSVSRLRALIKGDSLLPAISAASILAKTARDAEMLRWHERFPHYGLDRHKGYPTPEHLIALEKHGICLLHRKTFEPVKKLLPENYVKASGSSPF